MNSQLSFHSEILYPHPYQISKIDLNFSKWNFKGMWCCGCQQCGSLHLCSLLTCFPKQNNPRLWRMVAVMSLFLPFEPDCSTLSQIADWDWIGVTFFTSVFLEHCLHHRHLHIGFSVDANATFLSLSLLLPPYLVKEVGIHALQDDTIQFKRTKYITWY